MTESEKESEDNAITIPDPFTVLSTIVGILLSPLSLPFTLLSQSEQIPQIQIPEIPQLPPPPIKTPPITNEETWEWVDYRGKKREITIHRKIGRG